MTSRERFERAYTKIRTWKGGGLAPELFQLDENGLYAHRPIQVNWALWQACEAEMREMARRAAMSFAISGKPLDEIIDEEMSR